MTGQLDNVLAGKFPAQPPLAVISREQYTGYGYLGQRYNPDSLAQRGGLRTYKDMRLDEQVKAVMNFKRDAIFARGWDFYFEADSKLPKEEQAKRINVFQKMTSRIPGGFIDGLNLIATGRDFGYSMTEKVYGSMTIDGAEYVSVIALFGRDPTTFIFNTDEYSALKSCEQEVNSKKIPIDMNKFIHYVHNPEFDIYFGRSDLREAYKSWFWKTKMMDYWLLFGERLAGGFAAASLSPDANIGENSATFANLRAAVENMRSVSGIVLPPGVTLEIITPASNDHFKQAVEFFDLAIAKSLLVPNLLGVSNSGQTGAYAQSQTQLEAFFWTLNSDKTRLESCLNDQLFQDIGDQNWGDSEYPRFKFKELSSERLKWLVETWSKLVAANVVINTEEDERFLRSSLQMPERSEEDTPLVTPQQEADAEAKQAQADALAQGAAQEADETADKKPAPKDDEQQRVLHTRLDSIEGLLKEHFTATIEDRHDNRHSQAFSRAIARVHFTVIAEKQKDISAELSASCGDFIASQIQGLLGTDEQLGKLIDTDLSDIADIELSSSAKQRLNKLMNRALAGAWALGQNHARNETQRALSEFNRKFPDEKYEYTAKFAKTLRDKAADYLANASFGMAGDLSESTRKVLQNELQNAAKFGKSPTEARTDLWNAVVNKGLTSRERVRGVETDEAVLRALDELWVDTPEQAAHYLNTMARTKLFEAMNEARYAEFTDPELADFVEGLEYSAVLDERTTEICSALDGCQFSVGNSEWAALRPPNHFNCRSLLIPITKLDGWDGEDDPIPDIEPQEGFK